MKGDITKKLGPVVEVQVKLKLPAAFLEYIQEVGIKQKQWNKNLDEYCSDELIRAMTAHLDGDKEIVLPKHTIPRAIAFRDKEIIDAYVG
jgi:hypothetical protein